ncbi:MAG: hypothetical protein O6951_10225 [Actinobacteria bacterium]|nr:hypothetical protein [Actinomycetota bacterium]
MRKCLAISVVTALFVSSLAMTVSAEEHAIGLARAVEATMQGLAKSQANAADAPGQANRAQGLDNQGEKKTGRERAAQAISVALERENGNGNAFGRGYAAYIHQILIEGAISEELDQANHGQQVREMVHTFNELRRSQESS